MKKTNICKWLCMMTAAMIMMTMMCAPALAATNSSVFVQTAKVGSTKIVKDGAAYDMYQYTGGQAVLQQDTDGTLWIPVRIVSELAGLSVTWNSEARTVTLTDPETGDYWVITIGGDFAMKYNAAGVLLTQRWMAELAELRGGAAYICIEDITAIYGFQVYERIYNAETYVMITNQALTLSYNEITALCQEAALLL